MRGTSKYLVYALNVGWRNDKSGRSYVSSGDVCSHIEITEAYSSKLVISLSKIVTLRFEVEDV